jgi:hypothetical protein
MTARVAKSSLLRVGIIIDSFVQPRWVRKALENVVAAEVSTLELVVKVAHEKENGESLLYKLYNGMDRSMWPTSPDALELVSIEDLVGSLPNLPPDELKKTDLDVLLSFAPTELNSKFASLAKYGVWFYAFGTDKQAPPGFREVLTLDPITISSVRSLNGQPPEEQIIYKSVSPTLSRFSIRRNNNECYWKAAAFVARGLQDLHNGRNPRATRVADLTESSIKPLTNAALGGMFLKLSQRAASRALEKLSSFEQWVLAYRINQTEFKYLVPPAERFWADPFPIKVAGKHYIFFEEFLNRVNKAHISVIEVDQNGIISGPTETLNLDCHLSYPFVFEWRGEHYMIPETGDKNSVELYRSDSFPFNWKQEQVLLEAKCPLDATLIEVNGRWWMFVNIQEEGVSVNWDELHLYYADSPLGPWKPHARNPVISDVRSARPAGRLFWSNNVLYRPSQDSSLRYGYAITINRVDSLSPTEYSETEVSKIRPDWDEDILGVHTLNATSELTVIDCLSKRRRFRSGKLRPPDLGMTEDLLRGKTSN